MCARGLLSENVIYFQHLNMNNNFTNRATSLSFTAVCPFRGGLPVIDRPMPEDGLLSGVQASI